MCDFLLLLKKEKKRREKEERRRCQARARPERRFSCTYHQKPERYEEAEPEDVGAAAHPRRLRAILILATGAAGHPGSSRLDSRIAVLRYGATTGVVRGEGAVTLKGVCLARLCVLFDSERRLYLRRSTT